MENIQKFTDFLDDKIKLKGFLENVDGYFIKQGLEQGMQVLQMAYPSLDPTVDALMGAIADADDEEIIKLTAELLAGIVILLKK